MIVTTKDYLILSQLKSDLQNKLTRDNEYDTEVMQVKVGEWLWEDMKLRPAIAIYTLPEEIEKQLFENIFIKNINIVVDLFMDNQPGLGEFEDIYKFKDDVESFIFKSSDWTYQSESQYVGPSMVYIGGDHDPVKQAVITFFVRYKD